MVGVVGWLGSVIEAVGERRVGQAVEGREGFYLSEAADGGGEGDTCTGVYEALG